MVRHREEVVNVYFAEALRDAGLKAAGEQIQFKGKSRVMPDVLIDYMGLRCILEGKFQDAPNARDEVQNNASDRVRDGIAHIALGIVYPTAIRSIEQDKLKEALGETRFDICFSVETNYAMPEWQSGTVNDVLGLLRRAYEIMLQDDVLAKAVEALRYGTKNLIRVLDSYPACTARIAGIIGISTELPEKEDVDSSPEA